MIRLLLNRISDGRDIAQAGAIKWALITALPVCTAAVVVAGGWQYNYRKTLMHRTMARLSDSCTATIFGVYPVLPSWLDRRVPEFVESRCPHLIRTPKSVQFFPQSFSPKADLAALAMLPDIEEVEIADSRLVLNDLWQLKNVPKLKRLA